MQSLFRQRSVSLKDLLWLTKSLALLCHHGVPLPLALESLSIQPKSPNLQALLKSAALDLQEGIPLSQSLRSHCAALPRYYTEMLFAAEESGAFDDILSRLESHLDRELLLRRELIAASLYPCVVSLVSLTVGLLVLTLVVPSFRDLFAELDAPLPWVTRLALALSETATSLLVPILTAMPLIVALGITNVGKRFVLRSLQATPVYGRFLERCSLARVTGTIATLIGAGMPLSRSLELASHTAVGEGQSEDLKRFSHRIMDGEPLSRLLATSQRFPKELSCMAALGESSGALDETLLASSKLYESEARECAALLRACVEPMLVAGIGLFVGSLMLAVYLPIFGLGGLVQ
jgi:type IV pilus assembly protein PilC